MKLILTLATVPALALSLFGATYAGASTLSSHDSAASAARSDSAATTVAAKYAIGSDASTTALNLSKKFQPGVDTAYVAALASFPDSASVISAATKVGAPLLLTQRRSVPTKVLAEIKRLKPDLIVVEGGAKVISGHAYHQLKALAPKIHRDAPASTAPTSGATPPGSGTTLPGSGTSTPPSSGATPPVPGTTLPGSGTTSPSTLRQYPWHTGIASTTFWVGEIFDPNASDGSQMLSTYDSNWFQSYGGCDGVSTNGTCSTEARTAANGFFPTKLTPKENPFYLDLPFDDINDATALATRQSVIPWAKDAAYAGAGTNSNISLMKNRWVHLTDNGQSCYAQIEDAGPAQYHDSNYVFGSNDARPASKEFNGAGMDVSPAVNGCLHFGELDGESDHVSWQFVEAGDVPAGPWKNVVTTSGVR